MYLWIDNTTLHAAARCLAGTASPKDVDTFLQFATEVVFAEKIYYSTHVAKSVYDGSESIRQTLLALGLDPAVLVSSDNVDDHYRACHDAADMLAKDIKAAVGSLAVPDQDFVASAEPILQGSDAAGDATLVELLSRPSPERPAQSLLDAHSVSRGPLYMLAHSDELWRIIRSLPAVRDPNLVQLIPIVMRLYLNEQLARHMPRGAGIPVDYAPAAPRARLLSTNGNLPLKALDRLVAKVAIEASIEPLQAPSVAMALLQRARPDEPLTILREAIDARRLATELRKYLVELSAKRERTGDFGALLKGINDLAAALLANLGLAPEPTIWKAFDLQVIGSVPAFMPGVQKGLDAVIHGVQSRRTLVLSEFLQTLIWKRIDPFAREKLLAASTRNVAA